MASRAVLAVRLVSSCWPAGVRRPKGFPQEHRGVAACGSAEAQG